MQRSFRRSRNRWHPSFDNNGGCCGGWHWIIAEITELLSWYRKSGSFHEREPVLKFLFKYRKILCSEVYSYFKLCVILNLSLHLFRLKWIFTCFWIWFLLYYWRCQGLMPQRRNLCLYLLLVLRILIVVRLHRRPIVLLRLLAQYLVHRLALLVQKQRQPAAALLPR